MLAAALGACSDGATSADVAATVDVASVDVDVDVLEVGVDVAADADTPEITVVPDVVPADDVADVTAVPDAPEVEPADVATVDTVVLDVVVADVGEDDLGAVDVAPPFDPGPDPCAEVDQFGPVFPGDVATFAAQDALAAWPPSGLVFVGSSSIRRWERLAEAFSGYRPIQRGIGGAQLGDIAHDAKTLVIQHAPRGVVVFAGTNDLAFGALPAVVLGRWKCLRWRIGTALGWSLPVFFIPVTPTPARWAQWPIANAFNESVAALADGDPGLVVIDTSPAFLATGAPPAASLFDSDGLHLSESGYALWESLIRPAVEAVLAPLPSLPPISASPLPAGTRVRIDLGPTNPEDGEITPSPDYLGNHWNNWHAIEGGDDVLPGERLAGLVTTTGEPTTLSLVVSGGFLVNGRQNGGLLWPDAALLGDFAVGSATGDYFYIEANADKPGALWLDGLDPERTYTLRLYATRDFGELRRTRYTVTGGAAAVSTTLQTSGPGAGTVTLNGNDDTIAELTGLVPDAWGHLFIDVDIDAGTFAYLSALEVVVED